MVYLVKIKKFAEPVIHSLIYLCIGCTTVSICMNTGASLEVYPSVFELAELRAANGGDGSIGFTIYGTEPTESIVGDAAAIGDINGDDIDDFIVGTAGNDNQVDAAYVVYGRSQGFPAGFSLASLRANQGGDGSEGFVIKGRESGESVTGLGDINGDGIDDFAFGGRIDNQPSQLEGVHVFFGRDENFPVEVNSTDLLSSNGGDGSKGFVILPIDSGFYDDEDVFLVANAGDINGDGINEILLGAAFSDPDGPTNLNRAGEAYVIYGTDQGFPSEYDLASLRANNGGDGASGFILKGSNRRDAVGQSISGGRDVNDDGFSDILIGAPGVEHPSGSDAGAAYLVFGTDEQFPAEFELSSLMAGAGGNGNDGVVFIPTLNDSELGMSVMLIGDLNSDGFEDIAVQETKSMGGGTGLIFVVFGKTFTGNPEFQLQNIMQINGGDGSEGVVLVSPLVYCCTSIGDIGDINGDQIDDIAVGDARLPPQGGEEADSSYVIFGRESGFPARISLNTFIDTTADSSPLGFEINGIDDGVDILTGTGGVLANIGDVNGDGAEDMIAGIVYSNPFMVPRAGELFAIYGLLPPTTTAPTSQNYRMIWSVQSSAGGAMNSPSSVMYSTVGQHVASFSNSEQYFIETGFETAPNNDSDRLRNFVDNCIVVTNQTQVDSDGDSFGNTCDADLNNDGNVNFFDLSIFAERFLTSDSDADFNSDGTVNFFDLSIFAGLFLNPPGPSGLQPFEGVDTSTGMERQQ